MSRYHWLTPAERPFPDDTRITTTDGLLRPQHTQLIDGQYSYDGAVNRLSDAETSGC